MELKQFVKRATVKQTAPAEDIPKNSQLRFSFIVKVVKSDCHLTNREPTSKQKKGNV
jgi:hypothetical protein